MESDASASIIATTFPLLSKIGDHADTVSPKKWFRINSMIRMTADQMDRLFDIFRTLPKLEIIFKNNQIREMINKIYQFQTNNLLYELP